MAPKSDGVTLLTLIIMSPPQYNNVIMLAVLSGKLLEHSSHATLAPDLQIGLG
jgi:hypothetical protein